jgi:hypothetical protein
VAKGGVRVPWVPIEVNHWAPAIDAVLVEAQHEHRPQFDANHVGHLLDQFSVECRAERRAGGEIGRAAGLSLAIDYALPAV